MVQTQTAYAWSFIRKQQCPDSSVIWIALGVEYEDVHNVVNHKKELYTEYHYSQAQYKTRAQTSPLKIFITFKILRSKDYQSIMPMYLRHNVARTLQKC